MRRQTYAILAAILLGTIAIFVKLIDNEIPVMTLSFLRVFFAFLFLAVMVPVMDKNAFKIKKSHIPMYMLIGLTFSSSLTFFNIANTLAPVQNVVLIGASVPLFVLFFARPLLKERITKHKIITVIITLLGLAIINPFKAGDYFWGNILALAASVTFGLLIVLMRKEEKYQSIGAVVWFFFFASIVLLPFPFIYGIGNASAISWTYMFILGFIATGLAYLLLNLALQKLEAETTSLLTTIISPLVGIFLAILLFQELLNARILIGGAILIKAGIYLEVTNKKLRKS